MTCNWIESAEPSSVLLSKKAAVAGVVIGLVATIGVANLGPSYDFLNRGKQGVQEINNPEPPELRHGPETPTEGKLLPEHLVARAGTSTTAPLVVVPNGIGWIVK